MYKKLEGKIALIMGGLRGIGAGIAKRLAADVAGVAITYTKGADAVAAVERRLKAPAERRSRFRRTLPTPTPAKPRSKRPSRASAD